MALLGAPAAPPYRGDGWTVGGPFQLGKVVTIPESLRPYERLLCMASLDPGSWDVPVLEKAWRQAMPNGKTKSWCQSVVSYLHQRLRSDPAQRGGRCS